MKLLHLKITGLFGHFNHSVPFKSEGITIVTAPNGYGKTVCLRVIDAIFNRKLSYLCELQFKEIYLETSEGTLKINKDLEKSPNSISLSHSAQTSSHKYSRKFDLSKSKDLSLHRVDLHIPFLHRIGPREWEDHRTEEVYSFEEVVENFSEYLPDEFTKETYPDWYKDFSGSLKSHFIQDQRLIQRKVNSPKGKRRNFVDTIEKYADELSGIIKDSGYRSSRVSQQLDTTFPARLLRKEKHFEAMSAEHLGNELIKLQNKRAELHEYNLISSEEHFHVLHALDEIKDEDRKVLTLYVQDTHSKLSAYADIYRKIQLFSSILNGKRLSFKRINIDPERGFYFETDQGRPLKLTQLSSGEQHQVVLLYELIFKTENNILVLIDEPEISLHVAWQKQFLSDLQEIIKIQNMPVVIATHSPQIIGGNWDLTVDLEEGAHE